MRLARRSLGWLLACSAGIAAAQDLAVVSSATFRFGPLAPDLVASAFGVNLAASRSGAVPLPLPTELVGTSVRVTDSTGAEFLCGLYFASAGQLNFVLPSGVALGPAVVTVLREAEEVASGPIRIEGVAPGFYTTRSSLGFGAMFRIAADGAQSTENLLEVVDGEVRTKLFSMGPSGDRLLLVLLGTGYRGSEVTELRVGSAFLESNTISTVFHGELQGLPGIDQVISNVLPRRLEDFGGGLRDVRMYATAPGADSPRESNIAKVGFAPMGYLVDSSSHNMLWLGA